MSASEKVKVWDIFVRVFHWSMVIVVAAAWLTAEELETLHAYFGYTGLVLVAMRVIWGFVGTKYARFSNFLYSPDKAVSYVLGVFKGSTPHYTGHNPAAGWTIVLILLTLAILCASGHLAYLAANPGGITLQWETSSVVSYAWADDDDDDDNKHERDRHNRKNHESDSIGEDLHEGTSTALALLLVVHISGVILSSVSHRENLVTAMFTGMKIKREN